MEHSNDAWESWELPGDVLVGFSHSKHIIIQHGIVIHLEYEGYTVLGCNYENNVNPFGYVLNGEGLL